MRKLSDGIYPEMYISTESRVVPLKEFPIWLAHLLLYKLHNFPSETITLSGSGHKHEAYEVMFFISNEVSLNQILFPLAEE